MEGIKLKKETFCYRKCPKGNLYLFLCLVLTVVILFIRTECGPNPGTRSLWSTKPSSSCDPTWTHTPGTRSAWLSSQQSRLPPLFPALKALMSSQLTTPFFSLLVEGAALVHAAQDSIENSERSVHYLNEHLHKNDALCTHNEQNTQHLVSTG